jgi:carboxypeptidase Taq
VTQSRPAPNGDVRTRLLERAAEIDDLQNASALLSWDRQTMMPEGGHASRAQQLATLAGLIHARLSDPALADLVERLADQDPASDGDDAALVRESRRAVRQATAVPAELVRALSLATSDAHQVWVRAREENDGAAFLTSLAEIVRLKREEADALGWREHPYDALHDVYEPGSSKARLDALFTPLRPRLRELLDRVRDAAPEIDERPLRAEIEPAEQEAFVRRLVTDLGYDFARGRLDPTVHPFCMPVGAGDVRITTRYDRHYLSMALFGTVHEAGHAMYEQGIRDEDRRTPLGHPASLGVHESQSRLWENHVARGRPFWEGRYPALRAAFPDPFAGVPLDAFLTAVQRVGPSFIRVEADEVTYPLHVLLRYDLEVALVEGSLAPHDVAEAWNAGMVDLLGIEPPDPRRGFLQDVHWSMGAFGYFPTYALGSMMSAQLWQAVHAALPALDDDLRAGRFANLLAWLREHVHVHGARFEPDELRAGRFANLLAWLREHVHVHGARFEPDELLRRATGAPLGSDAYLAHLRTRVDALVGRTSTVRS